MTKSTLLSNYDTIVLTIQDKTPITSVNDWLLFLDRNEDAILDFAKESEHLEAIKVTYDHFNHWSEFHLQYSIDGKIVNVKHFISNEMIEIEFLLSIFESKVRTQVDKLTEQSAN